MATFPTSAITFPTRSNGQTIDAGHINGLQEEVAAIESGYLDGNARLNSSNSTLAALSVAGNSTFTGSVQVTGPSTFSTVATFSTKIAPGSTTVMIGDSTTAFKEVHCSSLYVAGQAVTFTLSPPTVKVSHSTTTSPSSVTWVGLNWDTNLYDSTGMHSTTTDSSRITFTSTGIYHVGANIPLTVTVIAGDKRARLVLNDSTTILGSVLMPNVSSANTYCAVISADVRAVDATDYVTVQIFYNAAASSGTVPHNSTVFGAPAFWAHRVSI